MWMELIELVDHARTTFAIEYAAADAIAPMRAVCRALLKGWFPVKWPFTNPKMRRATSVITTEAITARSATGMAT